MHYAKSTKEVFAESVVSSKMQFSSVQLHFIIHIHLPVRRNLPDGDYGGHNTTNTKKTVCVATDGAKTMDATGNRSSGWTPAKPNTNTGIVRR